MCQVLSSKESEDMSEYGLSSLKNTITHNRYEADLFSFITIKSYDNENVSYSNKCHVIITGADSDGQGHNAAGSYTDACTCYLYLTAMCSKIINLGKYSPLISWNVDTNFAINCRIPEGASKEN